MKRSKLMKTIGLLACLCLITSCFVGSTLAKYVTGASANDTARVAKFGVSVTAGGSLYGTAYQNVTNGNTPGSTNLTVESKANPADNVVAPGTKSANNGLQFAITGTPEVSVEVAFTVTVAEDIFLKATTGTVGYKNYTGTGAAAFAVANDYYPVVYTLKQNGTQVAQGNLAAIKTYLEGNTVSKTYAPGTDLSTTLDAFTLEWEWDFDDNTAGTYDKEDTLLGNLAADGTIAAKTDNSGADPIVWAGLTDGTDFNLDSDITIGITVTQVD